MGWVIILIIAAIAVFATMDLKENIRLNKKIKEAEKKLAEKHEKEK